MSNYIALRGKLEWVPGTKDAAASSENATAPKSDSGTQQKGSYWQWTGVWAFGDRIVPKDKVSSPPPTVSAASSGDAVTASTPAKKATKAQLQQPFRYTWDSKAFPKDVLVPSVVQPTIATPSTAANGNGSSNDEKKTTDDVIVNDDDGDINDDDNGSSNNMIWDYVTSICDHIATISIGHMIAVAAVSFVSVGSNSTSIVDQLFIEGGTTTA